MASVRNKLQKLKQNLDDSMGIGQSTESSPTLAPVVSAKDIGRRPAREFGMLAIEQVIPDPLQPRKEFDDVELKLFAENLKSHQQINPIRIRWSDEHQKWIIVAGERRWRAAKIAGFAQVACYFHPDELTPDEILQEQLIENIHRSDLKPIEEAQGYASLMASNKWTAKLLAEALQLHPTRISRSLALLKLPADVQQKVDNGTLSARSAYHVSRVGDEQEQRELAADASGGQLSPKQLATRARKLSKRKSRKPDIGTRQVFMAEGDWKIQVSNPSKRSYLEMEQALLEVLEEVRHRIDNNVQIF